MRKTMRLSQVALVMGLTILSAGGDVVATKCATVANVQPAAGNTERDATAPATVPVVDTQAEPPVSEEQLADEAAIREADEAFVAAYRKGDAKAVAALFTVDAEFVDEAGEVFQGREAIEASLVEFFAENPECQLEMTIDSIRFISPGIAIEDGSTRFSHPVGSDDADHSHSIDSRYTTVFVKTEGKWLAASIRDHAPKDRRVHRAQLEQLDWLVGDWVDEGEDSIVTFSCQVVDNGNFLLRQFSILIGGEETMSGTQRIGWDPLTGKLRTWIFDSEGAYGEGLWHQDGDRWILKCNGVTADGETASSTSIYTPIDSHTMTWQSIDYEIAGVQQPDSEVYTIVREAPAPAPVVSTEQD